MTDARGTVLAALLVAGAVLTWRGVQAGSLSPRTYAALVVVALMLIMLASFAPALAAAFAVLVAVAVVLSCERDFASLGRIAGLGRGR